MSTIVTLTDLIRQLARLGIGLEAEGGRLRLVAPAGAAVDSALLRSAGGHKASLQTFIAAGVCRREQLSLLGDWLAEAELMRLGDQPDCLQWSAGCRAEWARQMLAMAEEDGFLPAISIDLRAWLEQTAQARPWQKTFLPEEIKGPEHAASAAAGN